MPTSEWGNVRDRALFGSMVTYIHKNYKHLSLKWSCLVGKLGETSAQTLREFASLEVHRYPTLCYTCKSVNMQYSFVSKPYRLYIA